MSIRLLDPPRPRARLPMRSMAHATHVRASAATEPAAARVRAARSRLLMLDYDGTLAPFHADREQARPSERMRHVLRAISSRPGCALAVVSGRPIRELRAFLPDLTAHWVGENGWEQCGPDGQLVTHEPAAATRHRLGLAYRATSACGLGARLERKRTAIVIHTRGVEPELGRRMVERCRVLWATFFERDGLMLEETDGGLELRAADRSKGTAVAALMRTVGPDALPVYIGDDLCDEPAFRQVRPLGVTLRVGTHPRPTSAEWSLDCVEAVRRFLETCLDPPLPADDGRTTR